MGTYPLPASRKCKRITAILVDNLWNRLSEMPELPEVETVVRGLRPSVVGRTITEVTVHWSRELQNRDPQSFADRVMGQRVQQLTRRGKYILFMLTHDVLAVHLKMTGRLYVARPSEECHDDRWLRVTFLLDDGQELRFSDSRKFGRVYLAAQVDEITGRLGPEPLSDEFTLEGLAKGLNTRQRAIKSLLLDQTFLAGVGNIYADEALWHSQIDPRRKANTLDSVEIMRLYEGVRSVLQDGIIHEGSTINWYRKPDGTSGSYQKQFKVYDQMGKPCQRCGTPITKIWLGQRGTHFCSHCQK